ncbi:hypothetical protein M0R19_01940 [Candidatus Pacearchaeota archaeon]|nr:hypothetical protein [Candidatus Pacearchaeota archaeon]
MINKLKHLPKFKKYCINCEKETEIQFEGNKGYCKRCGREETYNLRQTKERR